MDSIIFNTEKYDLKSLLDAKHPLLEKMRDRAPGTYKHCQNVAELCESVAVELDIDPTMMRVLGQYHDVGKITFPECFFENQNGTDNIHDDLDPVVSFHLLSKHVADGSLILTQMDDFPNELINPIVQHHGNTVIKSLSNKAKGVGEDMFRYKNAVPPTTLEAAVLMICDSVEATVRSKEYDQDDDGIDINDIDDIIRDTCERLEADDQLDEIKVGALKRIKKALKRDLESKYHKRESKAYDDDITVKESRKK